MDFKFDKAMNILFEMNLEIAIEDWMTFSCYKGRKCVEQKKEKFGVYWFRIKIHRGQIASGMNKEHPQLQKMAIN